MNNEITTEMVIKEVLWENQAIDKGVAKYVASRDNKTMDATTGGQKLLKLAIPQLIAGIEEAYSEMDNQVMGDIHGGRTDKWVNMIGQVTAEQAALITLNKCLEVCSGKYAKRREGLVRPLTKEIGKQINQQVKFENWLESEKEILKAHNATCAPDKVRKKTRAQYTLDQANGQINRNRLARWEKKFATYRSTDWGDDCYNIGAKLLDICVKHCPEFFNYKQVRTRNRDERRFSMTDEAWNTYVITEETAEINRPFLLPTLIKPRDWAYSNGKVEGGYYQIDKGLFSDDRLTAHTSADKTASSTRFLNAVNKVQGTAWQINPFIHGAISRLTSSTVMRGGVTAGQEEHIPCMPTEEYAAMTKEEAIAYHTKRTKLLKGIVSRRGKHSAYARKWAIANELKDQPEFYYPHFSDFRGRLYPMPSELTPQGDQVAKGLLQFAKGEKLGATGLKWLMIHAANCYNMDKETLADREQWCWDNLEMLRSVSSNYVSDDRWVILKDDGDVDNEAFPFLAAAREITEAMKLSNPSDFVSHLAISQDGTCNGMQILSMLGKDQIGAEATNCTANAERKDLYITVANAVMANVERDKGSSVCAAEWADRLTSVSKARKVVKRAVMTVPYGVTAGGIATQLEDDNFCLNMTDSKLSAQYMTSAILEAMESVNGKAVEIMQYFQSVANTLGEAGQGLSWYTPMGLKVTQQYNHLRERRIKTVLGDITLAVEDAEMGLRLSKQANSSSPNIIHSLDAAMLQMTVERLSEQGHTCFAMIHDSYGMHASNVAELHVALREVARDMFGGDLLSEIHEYMQSNTDVTLPQPPQLGDYDINEITNAPYFFS